MRYLFRVVFLLPSALSAFIACAQVDGKIFRTDAGYVSGITVSENNVPKPLAWTGWQILVF
ncbi:MAG: hypothetical protein K0R82_527 [Flavipsychrobacter sp.]|jgi:hypothetical protein|nr:hypothetical protein [Flavipsychrobacter sp.]